MSVENATNIDTLDPNQPPGGDPKAQGDDHLRLIKSVLQASIKRTAFRPFYVPSAALITADYVAVKADDNKTAICDTSGGAITITLPTLTNFDAGWSVYVQKNTSDANPVFIKPPTGNINGFSKVRRAVSYVPQLVLWNGANFIAQRAFGVPIGACIEFWGTTLPNGCLWPDGTTFLATDFVELNAVLGTATKPDRRGRLAVARDDLGGTAAGLVTTAGSNIDGVTLKATGGAQNVALTNLQVPDHSHSITDPKHTHTLTVGGQATVMFQQVGGLFTGSASQLLASGTPTLSTEATGITVPGTPGGAAPTGGVSPTAHTNMPPSIISNFVLVAE